MFEIDPILESDFYKQVHWNQYPKGTTKVVSYYVPRMNRLKRVDYIVMFGLQAFIKDYIIDDFDRFFFSKPKEKIIAEYSRVMDNTLGKGLGGVERISKLHDLGYLPLEFKALPEGAKVSVGVPMFEVSNTHPDFPWLTNAIESIISCESWHPEVSATVGTMYRAIVDKYYDLTVDDNIPHNRALGDFSMRGQESKRSAYASSAGFLLSFLNTATVPTIPWLEKYYNCDCTKEPVGFGAVSTEHSVMCSNYAVDGDEITMVKRLLTELYPNTSFSMVSDSYDYWNLVDNILPQCKKEIMEHNGTLLVRGDSGDPVQVVTDTVFHLWDTFGGTINSKGYKVLNSHIKAIYGDSITPQRAEQIYQRLMDNGFASNNVSLGVGSFSMECLEEDNTLKPYTRDTFGIAIKATYCEGPNREPIPIFKNPKESTFKKSHKGCCVVYRDPETNKYTCTDGHTFDETEAVKNDRLKTVFKNGKMVREFTLAEIRERLHGGKF